MCKECANLNSDEHKAVRDFFKAKGKELTSQQIASKTRALKNLKDPFIVGNPHFTLETDSMPDGVHAKPRHMWREVFNRRKKDHDSGRLGVQRDCEALESEWKALPDPKPDYLEWAAMKMRFQIFRNLLTISKRIDDASNSVKATNTLLEFTKSKPKQEIEMSQSVPHGEIQDLFRQLGQLSGVPPEAVETFIGAYLAKPNSAN